MKVGRTFISMMIVVTKKTALKASRASDICHVGAKLVLWLVAGPSCASKLNASMSAVSRIAFIISENETSE